MQLAKITSKGQITIPNDVRKALQVQEGDRIAFIQSGDGFLIVNSNLLALKKAQKEFEGVAESLGVSDENDVVNLIHDFRDGK